MVPTPSQTARGPGRVWGGDCHPRSEVRGAGGKETERAPAQFGQQNSRSHSNQIDSEGCDWDELQSPGTPLHAGAIEVMAPFVKGITRQNAFIRNRNRQNQFPRTEARE